MKRIVKVRHCPRPQSITCFYCRGKSFRRVLPCDCPWCGRYLTKPVAKMLASELFLAARMNGLRLSLEWVKL